MLLLFTFKESDKNSFFPNFLFQIYTLYINILAIVICRSIELTEEIIETPHACMFSFYI